MNCLVALASSPGRSFWTYLMTPEITEQRYALLRETFKDVFHTTMPPVMVWENDAGFGRLGGNVIRIGNLKVDLDVTTDEVCVPVYALYELDAWVYQTENWSDMVIKLITRWAEIRARVCVATSIHRENHAVK